MQSRYYDPELGRFINADVFTSTGQGILGNNMFAYCNNSPTSLKDPNGHFGVLTLMGIGALVGGLIDYAGQVITNYASGMSGIDAWTEVDIGEIAASAFSGAISVIPGSAIWGDAVDAVGSNIIEHGVNAIVYGDEFDIVTIGKEIVSDYVTDTISPEFLPTGDVPRFIRDIKEEARELGVKGTKKLQQYLNISQISTIVVNGFNADTNSRLCESLGLG